MKDRKNGSNRYSRLNFKHLRYFAVVARKGSISAAATVLHVAPQTVSAQLLELEASLGQPLFDRVGRRLVLTVAGETALDYATSIFALGDELSAVLRGELRSRSLSLRAGITDSVPKLMTMRLLEPVLASHRQELELECREGEFSELLGRAAAGEIDMVLADAPIPASMGRSLQSRLLADSGTSFLAARPMAAKLSRQFPASLDGAPYVAGSAHGSLLAQAIEAWFARSQVRPVVVGRIEDSALLKNFGQRGLGFIAVPSVVEADAMGLYHLGLVGRVEELRQPVYLIRARRRRPHPLVAEIEAGAAA